MVSHSLHRFELRLIPSSEIQTYGGRATLRHGCDPAEHAVVYMKGDQPTLLQDEKGLTKQAIEIIPVCPQIGSLALASRIRFGKAVPIHHNVKAKELGRVKDEQIPLLVSYWRLEMGMDLNTTPMNMATPHYGNASARMGNMYVLPKSYSIPQVTDNVQYTDPLRLGQAIQKKTTLQRTHTKNMNT
jgi:hypothetical protein